MCLQGRIVKPTLVQFFLSCAFCRVGSGGWGEDDVGICNKVQILMQGSARFGPACGGVGLPDPQYVTHSC